MKQKDAAVIIRWFTEVLLCFVSKPTVPTRLCVWLWVKSSSQVWKAVPNQTKKPDTDPAEPALKPEQPKGPVIWLEPQKTGFPHLLYES